MTAPRSVGSVAVSVVPDATGWIEKLRAQIEPGSDDVGDAIGKRIGEAMYARVVENIDKIKAKLDELGAKDVNVKVKVDDNGSIAAADAKLKALDSSAGSGGGGFSIFGGKIALIGVAAIAAADVAIPAILAIGAAAAGALAGVGVLALGFSGIGAALQAHGQPSPGGGTGVQGAQLGIQSARISADAATQTAQDNLTTAIQAQAKAENDLHLARQKALQDLQDLDNQLKDNTLSQVQASINLKLAQQTLAVSLNAPGASQAQYSTTIAQDRLNVATAQQKLNELTLAGTRLTVADNLAHKQGVAGNPNVQAAQQTLVDANRKLSESQQNIATTAQKNAIALQQAQIAMVSAAAGANAFGQAMAKLNPVQQQFVEFLLSLKPLFDQLKLAASGFLPGLEAGLNGAKGAFGPILTIVGNVAKALGDAFQNIFAQLNTPEGHKFLVFLETELPKQIKFMSDLFVAFGRIFAAVFEAAAPLIDAIDQAFVAFFNNAATNIQKGGFAEFFNSLVPLIAPIGQALSAIFGLVGQLMAAFLPVLAPLLTGIATLAIQLGKIAAPVIKPLAKAFGDLILAVLPLLPLFAQMITQVLPPLIGLIDELVTQGFIPLINALIAQLIPALPGMIKNFLDLIAAVTPLIPPVARLLISLTPLLPLMIQLVEGPLTAITPLIKAMAPVVSELAKLLNDVLGPAIRFITRFFDDQNKVIHSVFDFLVSLVSTALNGVIGVFQKIAGPLKSAFSAVWDGIKAVWADVSGFFQGIFDGIVNIIDKIIEYLNKIPGVGVLKDLIKFFTGGSAPSAPSTGGNVNVGGQSVNPGIRGARASGGPVLAGNQYRVNEVGVETFVPNVNGYILDAGKTKSLMNSGKQSGRPITQYISTNDPTLAAHAFVNRIAARAV